MTMERENVSCRGRQIERFCLRWNNPAAQYKDCNIHYELRPTPGIGRGGKRSKKNEYWTFKRDGADHRHPERLLMRQTGDDLIVAFQSEALHGRYYTDNTLFTLLPLTDDVTIKYLCGLFNSRLVRYIYQMLSQETGKTLAQVKVNTVKQLPIAIGDRGRRDAIESLVDRILDTKELDSGTDTTQWEREIDHLVYDLYGLTEEEIAAVEARVGPTT